MKKKGVTLIEIIISMALMTVLLIPAANVVITARKTNTTAEIKKEATEIGQNVMENIRDLTGVEISKNGNGNLKAIYTNRFDLLTCIEKSATGDAKYTKDEVNKKGESYELNIDKTVNGGISNYSYDVPYKDYKKKYKVEIIPELIQEYKNQDDSKNYTKKQSYVPNIDTESDVVSDKCKKDYDLIVKMTNDYNIILDEDDYKGNKSYDETSSIVLVLKEQNGYAVAEIHRNKGTQTKIDVDPVVIYSKKLCSMDELNNKYKDSVKILFYLSNYNSKNEEDSYNLNQSLVVQSSIHFDSETGQDSDAAEIDVLSGDNAQGYLDVTFDDSSYVHSSNYFMPEGKTNRTGNLYSFTIKVTLGGEEKFSGKTTAIINKTNGDF